MTGLKRFPPPSLRLLAPLVVAAFLGGLACGSDRLPEVPAPVDARAKTDTRGGLDPDASSVVPPAPEAGTELAGAVDAAAPPETNPGMEAAPVPPPVDGGTVEVTSPPDQAPGPFVPGPSPRSIEIYDESTIVDFHLTFAPGDFARLMAPVGPDDARWVPCGFRYLGEPAVAAHCRRKGGVLEWPNEIKPQMIVRFNFIDKMGRFHGLRRLNLEAFEGTEAPVRDRLAMWLMRESGIDAPRVNHARVFKDGVLYGLYMNIEALDKEFLEDHFGPDAEGNLWEDGEQLKTNETLNDHTRLTALSDLVDREPLAGDHTAFFAALDGLMDIPQVLREMAAETVLLADDNFSNGSSNFYYYEHPKRGFMVLPWDFDTIITQGPVDADPFEHWGSSPPSKLRQLVNQNPIWRAQYIADLTQIRDNVFPRMPAKVDSVCSQIREAVRADPNRTSNFEDFEADCAAVRAGIPARIEALKRLLGR
jgi:spore coat protein CotH